MKGKKMNYLIFFNLENKIHEFKMVSYEIEIAFIALDNIIIIIMLMSSKDMNGLELVLTNTIICVIHHIFDNIVLV